MRDFLNYALPCCLLLAATKAAAQNAADEFYDPAAMAAARESVRHMHGDSLNSLIIGERLENQIHDGDSNLVWEAQGWIGYDLNKLWLKSEGHYNNEINDTEEVRIAGTLESCPFTVSGISRPAGVMISRVPKETMRLSA